MTTKLVDENGRVVASDLSKEEVEALADRGVEVDLPEAEQPEEEPEKPPEQEALEEQFDVEIEEIDSVDTRERMRWVQLQKRLDEYDSEVEKRQRKRDEHMGERRRYGSDEIKSMAEDRGLIEELQDGFSRLVTRPTPRPSQAGPRMDAENVVRRAAGDVTTDRLFEEERVVETGDRCIGICTDASGSIGRDMKEVKLAAACIAKATEIISDDFVMESFTSHGRRATNEPADIDLRIVTGPDEDFAWDHLDSFESDGGTPTAAGIRDTRKLMEEVDAREYVMIVLTDGKAIITEDGYKPGTNEPVEQARRAVEECRDDGYEVLGLGFGSISNSKMGETFGEGNYKLTTIDTITEDILELYESRMKVSR